MIRISLASASEREAIYRMRHLVYATELGQHAENAEGRLVDALDAFNDYLVATVSGRLAGFVSVTPPGHGRYSVDKYVPRSDLPFAFDSGLFEIRILTVAPAHRGSSIAALLMYAALRWVEAHAATRVLIMGRREIVSLYETAGLVRLGRAFRSGDVEYELMSATIEEVVARLPRFAPILQRLLPRIDWALGIPFEREDPPGPHRNDGS